MEPAPPAVRRVPLWALWALLALGTLGTAGCASAPVERGPALDAGSSLLAVDVRFPVSLGRDPSLVKAWFVEGPIHAGLPRLPELVPASFVKGSRAYLLDPEPGSWSLVAVTWAYAPPRNRSPVEGVPDTVASGGDIGHAVVFPSGWIGRTRTAVAPGRLAFMGALSVHEGERIHADTRFEDALQERLAEAVRPGVTSRSGLTGRFSLTWTLDLERSSLRSDDAVRESFLRDAKLDLAGSGWADFVPQPVPTDTDLASRWTKAVEEPLAPEPAAPEPAPATAPAPAPAPAREPEPVAAVVEPAAVPAPVVAPEAIPASRPPDRRRPLDRIVPGMSHDDVRDILGDPDERSTYLTPRALIPFYSGPDTHRRVWIYRGRGRVEFSLNTRTGTLRVVRVEGSESP